MAHLESSTLPTLLRSLRLPTMASQWPDLAATARTEHWSHERYLACLCEHELAARDTRRIQRRRQEANLPPGKRLDTFEFKISPGIGQARVRDLARGGDWIAKGDNLLIFGPQGTGKSHLAAGIADELIANGHTARYERTTDLLQQLQAARRDLRLPAAIAKLDRCDCLVLDDIGYVRKDQHETDVLFELISDRYERRSLIITSNQPFSQWEALFQDKAMTVAAIDRLVHHATILELTGESYRRREAAKRSAR